MTDRMRRIVAFAAIAVVGISLIVLLWGPATPALARPVESATPAAVAVSSSYVSLLTIPTGGRARFLNVEVENTGDANSTTGFKVQLQDHPSGTWYDYLGGTDFDSDDNSNMLFATSTGPHELTHTTLAHMHVRINAAHAVRLQAVCASGDTTVAVKVTASSGD